MPCPRRRHHHAPDRVRSRLRSRGRARLYLARLLRAGADSLDLRRRHQPRADARRAPAPGQDPSRQFGFQRDDWYHRKGRITDYSVREQVLTGDFPGGLKDLATERDDVRAALDRGVRALDPGGRLRRLPHRHAQARRARVLAILRAAHPPVSPPARSRCPIRPTPTIRARRCRRERAEVEVLHVRRIVRRRRRAQRQLHVQPGGRLDLLLLAEVQRLRRGVQERRRRRRRSRISSTARDGLRHRRRTTTASACRRDDALVNFMDNHDVTRFLFDKPSPAALQNALAFLLTEDGIPCIYYGTEQEFDGGNDPDQPRAAVGHRLPHRRRHVPVDPRSSSRSARPTRRCGAAP